MKAVSNTTRKHLTGSQYSERSEWCVTGGNALGLRHLPKAAWRAVPWISAIVLTLMCCSCGSTKEVTQTVRDISKNTINLTTQQYDSIYIYQDRLIDRSRDTLYIKDKSIEYRYKLLRDTVRIVERDSIPYEVTITEVKEITRPLIFYDKLCRSCFWFVIGFILCAIGYKVRTAFKR